MFQLTGRVKLGLGDGSIKIVLEEDGTEIDDDEILAAFQEKVLILLLGEEEWSSPETEIMGMGIICIITVRIHCKSSRISSPFMKVKGGFCLSISEQNCKKNPKLISIKSGETIGLQSSNALVSDVTVPDLQATQHQSSSAVTSAATSHSAEMLTGKYINNGKFEKHFGSFLNMAGVQTIDGLL